MDTICHCHGQPIVFRTRPNGQRYIVHIRDEAQLPAPLDGNMTPEPAPPLAD